MEEKVANASSIAAGIAILFSTMIFNENIVNNTYLDGSYQAILDRQDDYDIELVGNEEFLAWTTSDWSSTWYAKQNPDAKPPKPDLSML